MRDLADHPENFPMCKVPHPNKEIISNTDPLLETNKSAKYHGKIRPPCKLPPLDY